MAEKGETGLTYGTYLKIPELLSLQQPVADPPRHDETLFILVHQSYELWFKQILHEIDSAIPRIDADDVAEGTRLLDRVVEILRPLISQVRILETMRPTDFLGFRYHLNPASGFQSVQFREIEFVLGLKDSGICDRLACDKDEVARLRKRLAARTVSDAYDALLVRRGLAPGSATERAGVGEPAREEDWRLAALLQVYEGPQAHGAHAGLLALAEVLVDIDECLSLWRAHHVQMVERMIGAKPGTGGSAGVAYLKTTLDRKFFPELWELRSHLSPQSY